MINYGVVVGRFQVNTLHPGHLELFRQVAELHDRVIVFVGVPRTVPTKRNPLDFETRKKMIQAEYPDFTILPLRDEKSDDYWSRRLDDSISSVTQHTGNVTLYGGRDSFMPHYYGVHKVHQLEIPNPTSGTAIREKLSNRVMQSADFRAGAIYAATNQFKRAIPTVDVAICHNPGDGNIMVALGRKPGEKYFRFIGGFVEPGTTLEANARREVFEEAHADVDSLEYVASYPVDDWRYAKDDDAKITTTLFLGWTTTKNLKAGDDIEYITWFDFDHLPEVVEAAHMPLLRDVKDTIRRRYYANK